MKHRPSILLLLAASLSVAACSKTADQASADNEAMPSEATMSMGMGAPKADDSPATQGYKKSMNDMLANMPEFTGEADTDFMRQMKAHHGSAIAMAQTELQHGDDREARALAEKIIADQRAEIAQIDRWLTTQK